jgi:hypothetical protein
VKFAHSQPGFRDQGDVRGYRRRILTHYPLETFQAGSDLHPDGDRLVVPQIVGIATAPEGAVPGSERFLVVVNWFEEIRQRMGN